MKTRFNRIYEKQRDAVYAAFYSGLVQDGSIMRDRAKEIPVTLTWKDQKEIMVVLINCEKRYLITSQGTPWRISPEFAQAIADLACGTVKEKGE